MAPPCPGVVRCSVPPVPFCHPEPMHLPIRSARLSFAALALSMACAPYRLASQSVGASPGGSGSYSLLRQSTVAEVEPRLLRSIVLRDGKAERLSMASDAVLVSGRIFVLDAVQRKLLVYDTLGSFIRRAADWGDADGGLSSPVRLVDFHDSVFVLDVTHHNAVSAFDSEGRYIGARFPNLHEASASSLAIGNTIAAFGHLDASSRPGRTVVAIRDWQGREVSAGCPSADAYLQSEQRDGMLAHFGTRIVSIRGNRVFCAQAITPVVAILDLAGSTVGQIAVAPPFYIAPKDIGESRNQKTVLEFQSRWTALHDFAATPQGFASIYSRYDLANKQFSYRWFACDGVATPSNCRTSTLPGTPVRIMAPDMVLTVVQGKDGAITLTLLRVSR